MSDARETILEVSRLIYARQMSDSAGGNISLRQGNRVYITPRYMGEKQRWKLNSDDIILCDIHGNTLDGDKERISREGGLHFEMYREFPDIGGAIHAHLSYILPFAVTGKSMPAVTDMAKHFGLLCVEHVSPAEPGSDDLTNKTIEHFKRMRRRSPGCPLAAIIPNHGVMIGGRDLDEAYVLAETLQTNAKTIIFARLLDKEWEPDKFVGDSCFADRSCYLGESSRISDNYGGSDLVDRITQSVLRQLKR